MSNPVPVPLQFATKLASHKSGPLTAELAQNLYLEKAPDGSKFPFVLLGTPGTSLFATLNDGPVRGMAQMGNYLWVVSGDTLFRLSEDGTVLTIGTVGGSGHATLAHNGTTLWVGSTNGLYAADSSSIIQLDTFPVCGVTYQDGFLLVAQSQSQFWYTSTVDDGTSLNGAFTSADAFSDNLTGLVSFNRQVYACKEKSIEIYYNAGAADFPFSRTQVVERGVLSGASLAKAQTMLFFLGDDRKVYRMASYTPEIISDHVIAYLIDQQVSPQTASGFCYEQEGHLFYVLSFTTLTLVYDAATGLWHKRQSLNEDRWTREWHTRIEAWGKHFVGDCETGAVYEMDVDLYTDAGTGIQRRAISQPIWNNGRRVIVDELVLDIETGLAGATDTEPQIALDWTTDGGRTWSNEVRRGFGLEGEYDKQVRWFRCGGYRSRSFRITTTANVPTRIAGAYIRAEQLTV